jgi:hypothetical protein
MSATRIPVTGGGLVPGAFYTRQDLMRLIGMGRMGLAELRRNGCQPVIVNHRALYYSNEIIAYLLRLREEQQVAKDC